jgi:NOL1/NOP2/sun family putative RNA methylase
MTLERYRPIIPDWDAFHRASHIPEAVTLRVRRGVVDPAALRSRLEGRGFRLGAVPGLPEVFRVEDGPGSVAQTPEHWLGLFHIQQAVMSLPSLALAPRPGERVLDLCAAPGGKTVHLAELMEDRGPLVAVDPKEQRLRGLLGNVYRLGHSNVIVVAADGRDLPERARFDRVLVDAPCSAEGNYRRKEGRLPERSADFVGYVTGLQEALLRKGVALTRPGGVIVYSTCTFAPEENEAVVARILADEPVEIETIELDVPHAPGVTEWMGETYPAELERAWRLYPQHLDSGGMFMARLRRMDGDPKRSGPGTEESAAGRASPGTGDPSDRIHANTAAHGWAPIPPAFPGDDPDAARERIAGAKVELRDRYGMDQAFLDELSWMARGENLWVNTAGDWPMEAWGGGETGAWRIVSVGLRGLKRHQGGLETPSNPFIGRFGRHFSTDRQVELTEGELDRLLEGEPLPSEHLPVGPVALLWEGRVLGRGMVGRSGLRHQIGKAEADRLKAVLEIAQDQGGAERSGRGGLRPGPTA